jgi:hypothetical protein
MPCREQVLECNYFPDRLPGSFLARIRLHPNTHSYYTVVEGMRRDVRILLVGDGSFCSVPFISPWRQT